MNETNSNPTPPPSPHDGAVPYLSPEPSTFIQVFNVYQHPGGEERSVARIATHLELAGHRVVRFWHSSAEWAGKGAPSRMVQPFLLWDNPVVLRELRELHEKVRPRAWILHNVVPVISLGVYRLAKELNVPIIQWLHNYRPLSPSGALRVGDRILPANTPWLAWRETKAGSWQDSRPLTGWLALGLKRLQWRGDFSSVRLWIAISEHLKSEFQTSSFPFHNLAVLRHDWEPGPPPPDTDDKGYFLFLGRLSEEKGIRFLLDLWKRPELRDLPLVIAGDGPLLEPLRRQSPPNIKWLGFVDGDEKRRWIAGARAVVLPARWPEPLGLVIYEAYEEIRPVLASDLGGHRDIVRDNETGRLIPPDDIEQWVETILHCAHDPADCRRMGRNGRRWLEENTSPDAWNRAFDQIVATTIPSSPVPIPATRKRVLMFGYLPPPYFGPSVTYQALLDSEFGRHFDVTMIDLTLVSQLTDLEKVQFGKLLKSFRFLLQELRCLLRQRFDFCCAPVSVNRNAFLKDAMLLWLARRFRVPTVLYAHGNNLTDFYDRSPPWVQRVMKRTFSRAAGAIVLGERLRFNFDRWLPAERILVVPTGIKPSGHPPTTAPSGDSLNVLYLGNLVKEKGVFALLEAACRIAPQRPQVRFLFAGAWQRTDDEKEFTRFVNEHNLHKQVEFIGPVKGESKAQALARAALLAFPTFYYYETMGLVLLEAMEAGLPIVTTRRASIPEIIRDGVNGLLVEEQNPADLAEKLLRLIDDPALRQRMGDANRQRFASYYTDEQYGRRMIEAFERVAALTPASPPQ